MHHAEPWQAKTAFRSRQRRWPRHTIWLVVAAFAVALPSVGTAVADEPEEAENGEESGSIFDAFEFEGSLEVTYERRQNADLDSSRDDDLDLLKLELALELAFEPNEHFEAKFQPTLNRDIELREEGPGENREIELLIEEAFVTLTDPETGLSLRVGRQSFGDDREWLFDEELDAIRAYLRQPGLSFELSVSELSDKDLLNDEDVESITNYVFAGGYSPTENVKVGAYKILRTSNEVKREHLSFFGLYSNGTIFDRLTYWVDAAHVIGREDDSRVSGYGFDVLGTYSFDLPLSPYITLGYAFGSGDGDPEDGRDGAFRQTGLQGNEAKVGSLTPYQYYGEAFDPELSNMHIFTAGIGIRPTRGTTLNLVYHNYRQDRPFDELRDAGIDADPNGRSRRLGNEIDVVFGIGETKDLALRGLLGYFMPGRAFGDDADDALFAKVELRYEF